jgi:hypothetical protein
MDAKGILLAVVGVSMSSGEFALHNEVQSLYRDHHGWLRDWLRAKLGLRRGSRSSTGRVEHQYARKSTGKL